ncbi:MAG: bifunctional DNA primase/polymerase [Candidatus Heimdallarchaeota archaeon]|nr:bifunctional DNA primase/polymerase [Candidatus Heimdallarchaeota archaeon]
MNKNGEYIDFESYPFNYFPVKDGIHKKEGTFVKNGNKTSPFKIPWKPYQEKKFPHPIRSTNRAILTGSYAIELNPIVILDLDNVPEEFNVHEFMDEFGLPKTRICRTGSGGYHIYLAITKKGNYEEILRNTNSHTQRIQYKNVKVDFRGQGGLAFCPPTKFENKNRYSWYNSENIAIVPDDLILKFFEMSPLNEVPSSPTITTAPQTPTETHNNKALFNAEVERELARRLKNLQIKDGKNGKYPPGRSVFALSLSGFCLQNFFNYHECRRIANHSQSILDVEKDKGKNLVEFQYKKGVGHSFVKVFNENIPGFLDWVKDVKVKLGISQPSPEKRMKMVRAFLKSELLADIPHFLITASDELVYYDPEAKFYRPDSKDYHWLRTEIKKFMDQSELDLEDRYIQNVAKDHRNELLILPRHDFYKDFPSFVFESSGKLFFNLQNGVLKMDLTTFERELVKHDSSHKFKSKLDVEYLPDQQSVLYERTLKQVLVKDRDRQRLLFYFAYGLISFDFTQEGAPWCYGSGSNGKSTVIEPFINLFDHNRVSTMNVSETKNRFAVSSLVNCDMWYASESRKSMDLSYMHKIISGETLYTDRKNSSPIEFQPGFKPIITSNEMPSLKTDADKRRYIPIRFDKKFRLADKDPQLKVKLLREKSGLFNLILEYVEKYYKGGRSYFLKFDFVSEWNEAFDTHLDPFADQFYYKYIERSECDHDPGKPDNYLTIDEITRKYNALVANPLGYSEMSNKEVNAKLGKGSKHHPGFDLPRARPTINGDRLRVFHCLNWADLPNNENGSLFEPNWTKFKDALTYYLNKTDVESMTRTEIYELGEKYNIERVATNDFISHKLKYGELFQKSKDEFSLNGI